MNKIYLNYVSVENFAGTNLKLIPMHKLKDTHYIEQEYSAYTMDEINKLFKADQKEWLSNAFGYLD